MFLGIDAGGTHTDAVVVQEGQIVAEAKVLTEHDNLPHSVCSALEALALQVDLRGVQRVTLGTTLAINAIVQGRTDKVGLVLSAGPGIDPKRFAVGEYVHVVPGGLDHRGVEVSPLQEASLAPVIRQWREEGVSAFAVVGKFSPRNPAHEQRIAAMLHDYGHVTQGHELSALLNFPRRIAGAWYNSAVWRVHNTFLDAVTTALAQAGINAPVFLLKADGGAMPMALSRRQPVEAILSGPAASIMGIMALCAPTEDVLLLDVGGTTTDIGVFAAGFPVLDRQGMRLHGPQGERNTSVRALAAQSIGIGGDSRLTVTATGDVQVGPWRDGAAMAFGGQTPTLLDACNVTSIGSAGNVDRSAQGMQTLAAVHGVTAQGIAQKACDAAAAAIKEAVHALLEHVNGQPVYTLAALLGMRTITPKRVWLVGGPASILQRPLERALGIPVAIPPHAMVANAVGAALTLPTAEIELLADTHQRVARIPSLDWEQNISSQYTLRQAREDALAQLRMYTQTQLSGASAQQDVEVIEEDIFATLSDSGYGGKDIRVRCQLVPGIAQRVAADMT